MKEIRICPICGDIYTGFSYLSLYDSSVEICSICRIDEELEDLISIDIIEDYFLNNIIEDF